MAVINFTLIIQENGTVHAKSKNSTDIPGELNWDKKPEIDKLLSLKEEAVDESTLIELGTLIFDFLFCNKIHEGYYHSVSSLFLESYNDMIKEKKKLRIIITSYNNYAQTLPIELLYLGNRFLATQGDAVSIVRFPPGAKEMKGKTIKDRLKVLVILSDSDITKLKYARIEREEIGKVLDSKYGTNCYIIEDLYTYTIDSEYRPNFDNIRKRLRDKKKDRFNIIHYIGHSNFDEEKQEANVTLETSAGGAVDHSDRSFAGMFNSYNTSELGLVVLNSCESGIERDFAGLAQRLLATGLIPCVVGMQYKIDDEIGPILSHEFYTSLLESNYDVEEAIFNTRGNLRESTAGPSRREFAAPVLYYSVRSGRILRFLEQHLDLPRSILGKYPGQEKYEDFKHWIKREYKKIEFTSMVNRDSPMPVYIDNMKLAADFFCKLKDDITRGNIDHELLYYTVKCAKRWRDLCEDGSYPSYQWDQKIIEKYLDDIFLLLQKYSTFAAFDLISLGVGTGKKDYFLLKKILNNAKLNNKSISYYPIDFSISVIQDAMSRDIRDLFSRFPDVKFEIFPIAGNFLDLKRFKNLFRGNENPRLIVLLNNSLGSFKEKRFLCNLYSFLTNGDFIIIGVQFHCNRSEEDLIKVYQNDQAVKFALGPLEEAGYRSDEVRLTYEVVSYVVPDEFSDIPGSRTVLVKAIINNDGREKKTVQLFYSTQYDRIAFEKHLSQWGFEIIPNGIFSQSEGAKTVYCVYILKKSKQYLH